MLNSLIALKALGYPDDHPEVAARRTRAEEAGARNRRQRAHRALFFAGVGHGHRGDLPARIGRSRASIRR